MTTCQRNRLAAGCAVLGAAVVAGWRLLRFRRHVVASRLAGGRVLWLCLTGRVVAPCAERWQWPQLAQPTAAWSGALAWHGCWSYRRRPAFPATVGWLAYAGAAGALRWLLHDAIRRSVAAGARLQSCHRCLGVCADWRMAGSVGFGELADLRQLAFCSVGAATGGAARCCCRTPVLQGRWPMATGNISTSGWQRQSDRAGAVSVEFCRQLVQR